METSVRVIILFTQAMSFILKSGQKASEPITPATAGYV